MIVSTHSFPNSKVLCDADRSELADVILVKIIDSKLVVKIGPTCQELTFIGDYTGMVSS